MITSTGTSPKFTVGGQNMNQTNYQTIIDVTLDEAKPPVLSAGDSLSLAVTKWINPWPEFTFDAITVPKYDGVAFYLATPRNRPDFVKDYHFIALMRATDYYLAPAYDSYISCSTSGTPAPNPPIVPGNI